MATVKDALNIARTVLGDDMGSKWGDGVLMPKIIQAHGELVAKLALNGLPVSYETTARVSVVALAVTLTLPTDLIQPIALYELGPTDAVELASLMGKVAFLPYWPQADTLRVWAWAEQEIKFLGATANRDVIMKYIKGHTAPTKVTDTLVFNQSEIFLGPRVAALALFDKDKGAYEQANQMADANLSTVVRTQIKAGLPVRRKPFGSTLRRRRW